ncbi:MAG TPA: PadR family transcriptional regulator [Gemmatimonadaceae bacterium]|nr:PadR family transcriptional regulator [Gemmatimonadaceae bacterium]
MSTSARYCINGYNSPSFFRSRFPVPGSHLKANIFHILVALIGDDKHGLAIVRDVLEQTDGAIHLWPATLYGTLEQLADDGLIEELGAIGQHPAGESERRRYYRLTRSGRAAVMAEVKRLERLAAVARGRLAIGTTSR